jgi:hypothetical protein
VPDALDYDATLRALRASLIEVQGNARAFAIRARGRPSLLSTRGWAELAQIEQRLARDLADSVRLELHEEPGSLVNRARAEIRGLRLGLASEPRLLSHLMEEASSHPIQEWRPLAPQLEASLWPFFAARTEHLANAAALALNEPQPFPPLFWHPARSEFQRG